MLGYPPYPQGTKGNGHNFSRRGDRRPAPAPRPRARRFPAARTVGSRIAVGDVRFRLLPAEHATSGGEESLIERL